MISNKRLFLTTVLASFVNSGLMVTLFRAGDSIRDGRAFQADYWNVPISFGLLPFVQIFSWGFSTAGLFLLLVILRPLIPHRVKGWAAKALFVLLGVGIGSAMFGLMSGEPTIGGYFGAVTASLFVFICPAWFGEWRT
ncbi:hypothetical protein INR77_13040 [Erythrobacter sp. SCSIO 43205]|uniref:hypothetical protein n=1 Tax=Erythrobacter sp. SCSIO 43205 TaxID=2779361 RepID=UPI001CA7F22E|nr:hypothetical protein [Erythrobacter sp. SCSIO 43205]UAB77699.1 hypothetical protein INR77_13040 [Erythrobacter sp. SCSIO 43205]